MESLVRSMDRAVPRDAVVTCDAGNFSQWLLRYFPFDGRRALVAPMSGSMGYGVPAAIGAQRALPDRPCWALAGDGGFAMTMSEIDTAVRHQLSLAVILCDNRSFGTIRAQQIKDYPGRDIGTALGSLDFAAVAQGLGARSWSVSTDEECESALQEMASTGGVRVLHARVNERQLAVTA